MAEWGNDLNQQQVSAWLMAQFDDKACLHVDKAQLQIAHAQSYEEELAQMPGMLLSAKPAAVAVIKNRLRWIHAL